MKDLQQLREGIDEIDTQVIKLLAKRFELTQQVGEFKKQHALPSIDPSREARQFARIQKLAEEYGLDPEFASSMLRLIIDAVVANHNKIKAGQ